MEHSVDCREMFASLTVPNILAILQKILYFEPSFIRQSHVRIP